MKKRDIILTATVSSSLSVYCSTWEQEAFFSVKDKDWLQPEVLKEKERDLEKSRKLFPPKKRNFGEKIAVDTLLRLST